MSLHSIIAFINVVDVELWICDDVEVESGNGIEQTGRVRYTFAVSVPIEEFFTQGYRKR